MHQLLFFQMDQAEVRMMPAACGCTCLLQAYLLQAFAKLAGLSPSTTPRTNVQHPWPQKRGECKFTVIRTDFIPTLTSRRADFRRGRLSAVHQHEHLA